MKRIAKFSALALIAAVSLVAMARDRDVRSDDDRLPGTGATLVSLDLQGPSSLEENSMQRYVLLARYDDETVVDVTGQAEWRVDSPHAHVEGGVLSVRDLPADQTVTLSAWITHGLALKAARTLTLVDRSENPEPAKQAPAGSFSAREHTPRGEENPAIRGS
jgi:hypothetical protein